MNWYAFRTAGNKEIHAANELRGMGLEAVVVMRLTTRRRNRRHKARTVNRREPRPALPGYVFATGNVPWHLIRDAKHISGVVGIGGKAMPLAPHGAEWVLNPPRGLFHDTEVKRFQTHIDLPAVGDNVEVYSSGFDGMVGKVDSVEQGKARVLLPLFGSTMPVEVPVEAVVRVA